MFFLPIFIVLIIILNILLSRGNKTIKPFEAFMEEERQANAARKKEIPSELYIHIDKNTLPFTEYNNNMPNFNHVMMAQKNAAKKIELPMLKLPPNIKNNDIKFAYGIANFEDVVNMEENYNNSINALIQWADALIKADELTDAEKILNETIKLKSDFSRSYTLLCDIYLLTKNYKKLSELKDIAENPGFIEHNIPVRSKIRDYISQSFAKSEENL